MKKFIKPVFFGLLAFFVWIGILLILMSGVSIDESNEANETVARLLFFLLFIGSLFFSGAVAAWFAPTLWRESAAIIGLTCTAILMWFSNVRGDPVGLAISLCFSIAMSFAGAAAVRYFLKWLKL